MYESNFSEIPSRTLLVSNEEKMINFLLPEFMVVCSNVLLMVLLLTEILVWSQIFTWPGSPEECFESFSFGYENWNGPHAWKIFDPASNGGNQSPINIETNMAIVLQKSERLRWLGYDVAPLELFIGNNGTNVILGGNWGNLPRPSIEGGCLSGPYDFHSITFHWGPSDDEGTEHTIDFARNAMELQVSHIGRGLENVKDATLAKVKDPLAIVSYFFQVTSADNPYLDQIVKNLWRITAPFSRVRLPPFSLEWILPRFEADYYNYHGSMTQPPCCEIVTWLVRTEPIAISSAQMAEFRKICSNDGPIFSNCRPVQPLNDREILYYE